MEHHIDDCVSAYIDNELPPAERLEVEKHLQSCGSCNQLVEELLHLQSELIASFETLTIPDGLENRVWEKIKFNRAIQSGFVAFVIAFFLFIILLTFGTVVFKLVSIFIKVIFQLMDAAFHFVGLQPMMIVSILLFAIMLLVISSFSLRRLLRESNEEGDELLG